MISYLSGVWTWVAAFAIAAIIYFFAVTLLWSRFFASVRAADEASQAAWEQAMLQEEADKRAMAQQLRRIK